jgi:primary-amine oxidase
MYGYRKRFRLRLAAVAIVLLGVGALVAGATSVYESERASAAPAVGPTAPLSPLSVAEIDDAVALVEAHNRFPNGGFFPLVTLNEPPKTEVLAWDPGEPFRREAFANVYDRDANRTWEVVVDLRQSRVLSFTEVHGVQPAVYISEFADADAVVRADPRWRAAMQRRGVNPGQVYLDVWAPGELPEADDEAPPGTRLLRAISFFSGNLENPYDRPIEGVVVTVDMNRMEVVDVIDTVVRPVNRTISGDPGSTRGGLKPLVARQVEGPSFTVNGQEVAWQKWRFRVGFSTREGVILHQIGYREGGFTRPVIHRLSMSEIFVPYGIPDLTWSWRAALDVGEYNLGQYSEGMSENVDVPENAVFFDGASFSDTGSVDGAYELPHVAAVYERDGLSALWDRLDPETLERDARFGRELVVATAMVIGNYTYSFSYIFRQDGGMEVRVGATGTTLNRGVSSVAEGNQFGKTVAPNIAAPNHQHFFNFRIDFDVDGTANQVVEENIESVSSPFGNAFRARETVLASEGHRDLNPQSDRAWVVESTTEENALGEPTAYHLMPREGTRPYASPSFRPLQQAAFAQHQLWVTRFHEGELYAAGDYPNQGEIGDGLPDFAAPAENVQGRDVVVWYTVGLTHIPRPEDFPVMPTEMVGFSLHPHGFFDENPALDVPRQD